MRLSGSGTGKAQDENRLIAVSGQIEALENSPARTLGRGTHRCAPTVRYARVTLLDFSDRPPDFFNLSIIFVLSGDEAVGSK